jgi:hypothetical protein
MKGRGKGNTVYLSIKCEISLFDLFPIAAEISRLGRGRGEQTREPG